MNDSELLQMIADHYLGEAQLLTTGAEANLLKLAELRGNFSTENALRWEQIKKDFLRNKALGGDDADTGAKLIVQMAEVAEGVQNLGEAAARAADSQPHAAALGAAAEKLSDKLAVQLAVAMGRSRPEVNVVNEPVPGIDRVLTVLAETLEHSIFPLVRSMDKKLDIDLRTHDKMNDISQQLRDLGVEVSSKQQKD